MTRLRKRRLMFYLSISMIAMILLGVSLTQMEFQPGEPFPTTSQLISSQAGTTQSQNTQQLIVLALRGTISFLFILGTLYLIYLLFRHTSPKQIVGVIVLLAGFLLIIYILTLVLPQEAQLVNVQEYQTPLQTAPFKLQTEPLEAPPLAWEWVVAAALGLLGGSGLWLFWNRRKQPITFQDSFSMAAKTAMQNLLIGDDLREAILACYRSMSDALSRQQGLTREHFMTAREFETYLESRGVPAQPVRKLSSIFESARYSEDIPTLQDKQQCLESLQAIIQYCQTGEQRED